MIYVCYIYYIYSMYMYTHMYTTHTHIHIYLLHVAYWIIMFLSGAIYNSLTETPFFYKDNLPFKLLVSLGSRDPQNNIDKAVSLG